MELVTQILFPSRARRSLLLALFRDGAANLSVSELARRAGLTPRAVAVEVARLDSAGLVRVEAVGSAHVVRPCTDHPAISPLRALLGAPTSRESAGADGLVRLSLASYGAPLLAGAADSPLPLVETLLRGLALARSDAAALVALPVVLARQARDVDFRELKEGARRQKLKAELGLLFDLTADVGGMPELRAHASGLADGRRRLRRSLPASLGTREWELAEGRSPPAALRWNFRMNTTEEAFRAAFEDGRALSRRELVELLRAADGELREIAEVTATGSTALALLVPTPRATGRLELAALAGSGLREALDIARRRFPGTAEPRVAAPSHPPGDWRVRLSTPGPLDLRHLRVFVPERHDLALMGLASGLTRDLEVAEDLHRTHPLRLGVLIARYFEVDETLLPSPRSFRLAFLALVERLFGPDAADRTARGLPAQAEGTA